MLRRMQVERDDVGGLALEVPIVRGHIATEALELDTLLAPHPRYHRARDPEPLNELTGAPVRRGRGLWYDRPFENARLELCGERAQLLAGIANEERREALLGEALAPVVDDGIVAGELLADLGTGLASLEQQDQPRVQRLVRPPCLTRRSLT